MCRCGWSGQGEHLCHRCGKKPGSQRFYQPNGMRFALAGAQLKFSVRETWGCDECWEVFGALLRSQQHGTQLQSPGS